jgi:aminoglycoside phosphotransferase (APT) family kinase protein
MTTSTPSRDELIDAVVYPALESAALPRPDLVERAREGIGNHVYFAGDAVVRVGTGTDGAKFPAAVAVLRAAAPVVRVPEVLYADTTCGAVPFPVMVLRRLAGASLSRTWPRLDAARRLAALEQIAHELERLHAIPAAEVPGAGFTEPWWASRVAFIERELARHREAASLPSEWLARMECHLAHNRDALMATPRAGLLHGDVGWSNVLFDGDQLSGLIDFDDTRSGPSEEDAWQLLFRSRLETEPWMPLRRIRELPGFDLSAAGALARYLIHETENILLLLTGTLSWRTPEAAREEAIATYRDAFESDRIARLLDALR